MHAANLGDRREKVVYPAWWENRERLIARRLREMNFYSLLTELHGLPAGMSIKLLTGEYKVWLDGVEVYRQQFTQRVETAANALAAWIEDYRKESEDIMGISEKAIAVLRQLAQNEMEKTAIHAPLLASLVRKGLVEKVGEMARITAAGSDELRGLPEFDMPLDAGDVVSVEMPFVAGTCEESMTEDQLWAMTQEARAAMDAYDAATIQQLRRELPAFTVIKMDELRSQFEAAAADGKAVKLVLGEGVGLGDVVQRDGAEMMAMGGVVIHLEIKLPLLFELYPPLRSLLDGFEAIGATVSVYGDLNITVERAECEEDE